MGAHPAAAALDTISPTEGGGTVRNGQAGDLELNAVDGGGGHNEVVVNDGSVARMGAGQPAPHESIQVGRHHVGGIRISGDACDPPTLSGVDLTSEAVLRGKVRRAGDPHGFAGLEVRALRVDCHRIGVGCFGILQGRGADGQPAP